MYQRNVRHHYPILMLAKLVELLSENLALLDGAMQHEINYVNAGN